LKEPRSVSWGKCFGTEYLVMLETRRELIIGAYGAHWGVNRPEPAVVLHDETGRCISRCRLRDPPWTFPSSSHSAFLHCRLGYWISLLHSK